MKLSLCITTYNRYEMTIESFAQVLKDPRIDDVVIMDDCSTDESFSGIAMKFKDNEKVRVFQQEVNVGMSRNKFAAIKFAKNEWCIIFDSDNIMGPDYLDAFYNFCVGDGAAMELFKRIADIEKFIFCPDFAKPQFDYTAFRCGNTAVGIRSGIYGARECAHEITDPMFNCLMNTCNYIVHKDTYLATYKHNLAHKASDTIWHNYNHLKNDGKFCVVPGMQYYHRVHKESGFMQDVDYNMLQAERVKRLIQQL